MRFARDQLILKALTALQEIADSCGDTPAPKSFLLRFTLAYLFIESGADPSKKWLFTSFWTSATAPMARKEDRAWLDSYSRRRDATSALVGICRELGFEPTVTFFHQMVDARKKHRDVS